MPPRGHPSQERLWALSSLPMAHGPEPEVEGLLDLSFLTQEEQEAIADVLRRDARLRQLDEGRVSKLRASLEDPRQLKTLTGDWFQEARSQRHQHSHWGSDLVRASIRRKKSSRGDQALGSDGEAEASGKETEEEARPRWLPTDEEAPQERRGETQEPDFPSPLKVSDHEEEPQMQEAPGPGDAQVDAEQAEPQPEPEPEPEPEFKPKPELEPSPGARKAAEEPRPGSAQIEVASEILENGEEAPGPGPSLDRMLSSSSSVSSLNSSTLSGSLMSLSGELEAGAVQVCGSLNFALRYDPGARELRVHVIQCQGLAAARRRRSDPYVKSYLLPDKQSKRKTAVKKRNLNPIFNEILRYSVPQTELPGRVLSLSVWHRESLGRNIFLGEVEVPLDTWNWDSEPTWLPLQPRVLPSPDELPSRGLLSLSLKYVPAGSEGGGQPVSGELHFWVKEAQNLLPLRSGSLDSFVQCSVLPDDSRAGRQRTRVVRHSLSPRFNHTMVYDGFGPADLRQACAELSLWDHGTLASRQLGGVRLSLGTGSSYGLQVPWMDSTPEEKRLWQTLLERPCEWVDGLLPLRTNLVPRT
ncbi:PREDICTED: LOW QUALITY PROTEIN: synaptotagmin-like protein 1 [Chinchilla lanigera]|uniref:LOW QUALITY PROTEIN: synaptotagmin-like protein 1 n=1 Tax=Chinchilla lanigera TaxID=34839 RepID=UPI00038F05EF|nr:PREDICTED: LOW QUALITY PROTEIN: synaptotagmin-like protein 1 [Chinchilla lanigera]